MIRIHPKSKKDPQEIGPTTERSVTTAERKPHWSRSRTQRVFSDHKPYSNNFFHDLKKLPSISRENSFDIFVVVVVYYYYYYYCHYTVFTYTEQCSFNSQTGRVVSLSESTAVECKHAPASSGQKCS